MGVMKRDDPAPSAGTRSGTIRGEAAKNFIAGMDDRWFSTYGDSLRRRHIECACSLSKHSPAAIHLETGPPLSLSVVSWDHGGLFSLIAGILSASGFNIQSGEAFTTRKPEALRPPGRGPRRSPGRPRLKPKPRIAVDVFRGGITRRIDIDRWLADLGKRLNEIGRLLHSGIASDARRAEVRVQGWVADAIGRNEAPDSNYLSPVQLEMDESVPGMNRMRVEAEDTPFFLYALGTALALEGITVERVLIGTPEGHIEDVIDFTDAAGRRIDDPGRLDRVKMCVLLTKQFTYFLPESPNPRSALEHFKLLIHDIIDRGSVNHWLDLLSSPMIMRDLAALLGAGDYLWEDFIRRQYEILLPMLKNHAESRSFSFLEASPEERLEGRLADADTWEEKKAALNRFKDREIFRIDLNHILIDGFDFHRLSRDLTRLADLVVRKAMAVSEERQRRRFGRPRGAAGIESRWAVFGLGKMGGSALGCASDIELLFIYADSGITDGENPTTNADFFEHLLRDAVSLIEAKQEGIFQIDLRLRPYGKSGLLASSLDAFCAYYAPGGEAASLEKLALVRLRHIPGCGDAELGERVARIRDELIFTPESLKREELAETRRRQLVSNTKIGRLNAKFSVGAMVDLEYTVQILQAEHGMQHPSLRTPGIHAALHELSLCGVLEPEQAAALAETYDFLRSLINALRMLRGSAKDLDLPDAGSDEYRHLARRMGGAASGALSPERRLHLEFETRTAQVRAFVERVLGRKSLPGPRAGNIADLVLTPDIPSSLADPILTRCGYSDTEKARTNLRSLAAQGNRRRRLARLMVLASDTTCRSADSDMALNNWERLVANMDDPEDHFDTLLAQPSRLEILHKLLAGSQFFAETLIRNPDLFEYVTDPRLLGSGLSVETHRESLAALAEGRFTNTAGNTADNTADGEAAWRNVIRAYRKREMLRIGTRDLAMGASLADITEELADLAQAIIEAALQRILRSSKRDPEGYCVTAFGKLGGRELNYSSDIDLLGLAVNPEGFVGIQEALGRDLSVHTAEGPGYRVDMRLRPWGRSGDLVQSIDGLIRYYNRDAALWEIQALLKMRPVAGAPELGADVLHRLAPVFERRIPFTEIAGAIEAGRRAALKESASSLQSGRRDIKNGRGGIRDIEFLVQGLQLKFIPDYGQLRIGGTLDALRELGRLGLMDDASVRSLVQDYTLLRRVEHLLQVFDDRQVHHLPADPRQLAPIAVRTLGHASDAGALEAAVDGATSRVFACYERYLLEPAGIPAE